MKFLHILAVFSQHNKCEVLEHSFLEFNYSLSVKQKWAAILLWLPTVVTTEKSGLYAAVILKMNLDCLNTGSKWS